MKKVLLILGLCLLLGCSPKDNGKVNNTYVYHDVHYSVNQNNGYVVIGYNPTYDDNYMVMGYEKTWSLVDNFSIIQNYPRTSENVKYSNTFYEYIGKNYSYYRLVVYGNAF